MLFLYSNVPQILCNVASADEDDEGDGDEALYPALPFAQLPTFMVELRAASELVARAVESC